MAIRELYETTLLVTEAIDALSAEEYGSIRQFLDPEVLRPTEQVMFFRDAPSVTGTYTRPSGEPVIISVVESPYRLFDVLITHGTEGFLATPSQAQDYIIKNNLERIEQ